MNVIEIGLSKVESLVFLRSQTFLLENHAIKLSIIATKIEKILSVVTFQMEALTTGP